MVANNFIYKFYTLSLLFHIFFFLIFFIPHNQNKNIFKKNNTLNINFNYMNKRENASTKIPSYTIENKQNVENKNIIKKKEILKIESPPINLVKPESKNYSQSSKVIDKVVENDDGNKNITDKISNIQSTDKAKNPSFKEYNNYLKRKIQIEAARTYPKISIRKKEQGKVELIFSLNSDGFLKKINIGENTDASKRLIKAAKKTIERLSPFKKTTILNKESTFSIVIIYKLN